MSEAKCSGAVEWRHPHPATCLIFRWWHQKQVEAEAPEEACDLARRISRVADCPMAATGKQRQMMGRSEWIAPSAPLPPCAAWRAGPAVTALGLTCAVRAAQSQIALAKGLAGCSYCWTQSAPACSLPPMRPGGDPAGLGWWGPVPQHLRGGPIGQIWAHCGRDAAQGPSV